MTLIVDGYNLLHASGVFGRERGSRGFEQSRTALLDMLVDLLGERAGDAIVVFDAAARARVADGGRRMDGADRDGVAGPAAPGAPAAEVKP